MMHIACAADDNYAPHAAAMLHSLKTHHADRALHIHFLCDSSLSYPVRKRLFDFAASLQVKLDFLQIEDALAAGLPADARLPKLCWYRLLLPDLLPHVDRLLYLDTDIVVVDSLTPLWDLEMGNHYVAAVNDFLAGLAFPKVAPNIGISYEHYFNSGMLLLNMKEIRNSGGSRWLLDTAHEHKDRIYFPDQDVLNMTLGQRSILVSARWNYPPISIYYFINCADSPLIEQLPICKEVRTPDFKPAILHYLANPKPWQTFDPHPYYWFYHKHAAATPWAPSKIHTAKWWARSHVPRSILNLWRRLLGRGSFGTQTPG